MSSIAYVLSSQSHLEWSMKFIALYSVSSRDAKQSRIANFTESRRVFLIQLKAFFFWYSLLISNFSWCTVRHFSARFVGFSDSWFVCFDCCVAGKFVALGKIINFPSSSYALSNGRSISSCTNSSNFSKHCCKLSRMSVFKAICAFGKLSANPSFWQPVQQFQAIKQKPCPLPYIREEIFVEDILDLKLEARLLPR